MHYTYTAEQTLREVRTVSYFACSKYSSTQLNITPNLNGAIPRIPSIIYHISAVNTQHTQRPDVSVQPVKSGDTFRPLTGHPQADKE